MQAEEEECAIHLSLLTLFRSISTKTNFKQQLCIYLTFLFSYMVNIIEASSVESV